MSKTQIILVTDDFGGEGEATPVPFSFNGKHYEIDLNAENAAAFAEDIEPYIAAGRQVARKRQGKQTANAVPASRAREWARAQGMRVGVRGRVPAPLLAAYTAAHTAA